MQYKTGVSPPDGGSDLAFWGNTVILGILFAILAWGINRDYDGAFTKWFILAFPKESSTIGLS